MTTIDISDRKQGEFWAALAEAEKGDRDGDNIATPAQVDRKGSLM